MSTHNIHLFISHAWQYSDHYDTLVNWIFDENWSSGQASLDFKDYSIPQNDPVHTNGTDKELKAAIDARIARSSVIVIITGVYASYSKWIQKEIDSSVLYGKPILAVNPWGAQKTSTVVAEAATKSVGWDKKSVVDGIWELHK